MLEGEGKTVRKCPYEKVSVKQFFLSKKKQRKDKNQ